MYENLKINQTEFNILHGLLLFNNVGAPYFNKNNIKQPLNNNPNCNDGWLSIRQIYNNSKKLGYHDITHRAERLVDRKLLQKSFFRYIDKGTPRKIKVFRLGIGLSIFKKLFLIFSTKKDYSFFLSDYYKNTIVVKWHILQMSDVEVEENGKKIKTNKGDLKMTFEGVLEKDYEENWEKTPFCLQIDQHEFRS